MATAVQKITLSIEEVGRDVRAVRVGDRVTIPFHESDGTCPECRSGYQNLCDHVIVPGVQRLGGWAQYVTVSVADLNCIKLPEGVNSLSVAALARSPGIVFPRSPLNKIKHWPQHRWNSCIVFPSFSPTK